MALLRPFRLELLAQAHLRRQKRAVPRADGRHGVILAYLLEHSVRVAHECIPAATKLFHARQLVQLSKSLHLVHMTLLVCTTPVPFF
ncbi:hypothetical protein B1806_04020 [Metallibacterium scheffleri]|uniref:Uncharacterized protein n=1 Tax=Metallibacterium scheffleri TaxID=993689 RepID=A0A4S3KQH6_9GAMM|nr:hypothetical protein B1806_04020 [Metallibacterium scheffleri]